MCDNLLHWFLSQCMVWLVVCFFIRLSSLASPVEANDDDLQVSEPKKPEPTVYTPPILNPYYSEYFPSSLKLACRLTFCRRCQDIPPRDFWKAA